MDTYFSGLATETANPATAEIDRCTTEEMVALINGQDQLVAMSVEKEKEHIAQAVDLIYEKLSQGGRLIYIGAGTSGRLGVLDASECVPTFGVSPELVQGYIAGGDTALRRPVEGAEDSEEAGIALIEQLRVSERDAVVGITASGSAPYVLAALHRAKDKGAAVIGLCTNAHSKLEGICEVTIAPEVGPEVILGSTRMKSGTAQKMVLNMLSTCVMIKMGKVYGNLMVDLQATNKKLRDRARRLVCRATGAAEEEAIAALEAADYHVKTAILMLKARLDAKEAREALDESGGMLRNAIMKYAQEG